METPSFNQLQITGRNRPAMRVTHGVLAALYVVAFLSAMSGTLNTIPARIDWQATVAGPVAAVSGFAAAQAAQKPAATTGATVGEAMASQGNAALIDIRRESTRLPMPALESLQVTRDDHAVRAARAWAQVAALRKGIYVGATPSQPVEPAGEAAALETRH
jgi:hypothetical protein